MLMNPDYWLEKWVEGLVKFTRAKQSLGLKKTEWAVGEKLKLLFVGYNGSRNTGADVRVEEMIRQVRHLVGEDNADFSVLTIDPNKTQGYFKNTRQIKLPQIFPPFLFSESPKHHGIVACEGSMFKSKFANALSTMMAGALGMANAEKKLSVGYGAEVGAMTPDLEDLVRKVCKESFILCRNEPSRKKLSDMGIRNVGGADTAWTFPPAPVSQGQSLLKGLGWDGQKPVVFACPINPFWWPVKPSLKKFLGHKLFGWYKDVHYQSIYFHEYDAEKKIKYQTYLKAYASAISAFEKKTGAFVALVSMEALDIHACRDLNQLMGKTYPVLWSDEVNMYDLVSALRCGGYMLTSRFHAAVTSMPGGVVPIGITMDERIRNLLTDANLPEYVFEVDEVDLEKKLLIAVDKALSETAAIREKIKLFVPKQLKLMAQMGKDFLQELARIYPQFPQNEKFKTWQDYLPPLSEEVTKFLKEAA